ncbi:MAG: CAP domain-containing protein [Alkalibacterium sp.]|nr:CAP domain-containing protein [Alkalibacterium sp.]
MKVLRKLISLLLAIFIGFWLGVSGLLNGTRLGNWMNTAVDYLPTRTELSQLQASFDTVPAIGDFSFTDVQEETDTETNTILETNEHAEVDYDTVEQTIITLVNELRQEQNLNTLASNDMLKAAAIIRAKETEESFSHTRPNGTDPFTVFEEEGISYPYKIVGENLGMATYYLNEEEMAELLFDGWVESKGHYENMIRPDYEEIGVGVHYDGEFLYATQLFGTPL